ncbi:uncharacterized protein LOC106462463 [Limulus polyphemus]|uniref:Uncharacterized protein LOC106462463 n=1 Tax=Limulus polyphemus TaxID=6850 RepID=A0ABM1SP87_LIMPO|nr:uncharacterized protein LOC106462463 [Limulus polyphemus]
MASMFVGTRIRARDPRFESLVPEPLGHGSPKIYMDWANNYLEIGRFKHYIQDLQFDVSDGVLLADVIEAVTGFHVPNIARKPKTSSQMCNHEAELQKSTSGSGTSAQMQQPTITAYCTESTKYKFTHYRQKHITNKLVNFIAGTLQPFSVVESKDFQDLMAAMDSRYISSSRNHLSTTLIESRLSSTSSPSSSFSLPVTASTGVALRHPAGVASTECATNDDYDTNTSLDNNKQKCSIQKSTKRVYFDVSKQTSCSSGFSSSTDVSELLSVASPMSKHEITNKSVSATKHLSKKTPGGRKTSNVRQANSRPTSDRRKDVQSSRINQLESDNEVKNSNAKSSTLPRRAESKDSCSLPRSMTRDKECGKPSLVSRTETSRQGRQHNGAKGQMCKSIQPNKPIRQSKISSLIPKTGQTIKTASSGNVFSSSDVDFVSNSDSVCGEGALFNGSVVSGSDMCFVSNSYAVCGDGSLVGKKDTICVPSEHPETSSTPKPTAAVKGTSKTIKKQRCLTITAAEDGKSDPNIGTRQTPAIQSGMCQEGCAPVKKSKDTLRVTNEANRQVLGSSLKPSSECGNSVSLPKLERTKQGSTISVAKVSPMMNTSIHTNTKDNSERQQGHSEEKRFVNSNLPVDRSMRIKDETQENSNKLLKLSSHLESLRCVNSGPIINTEKVTEINYRRSTNNNVSQESDDSGWNTDALLADEADDIIVNIKPMKPITHFPHYGYNRGLSPLSSTRNFVNKLQSPALHFLSDVSGSTARQLTLSKHTITAGNLTTNNSNPMKRSFSSSQSFLNVDYSSDADSVDFATGYISDGDVFRPRFIYSVKDVTNGHLKKSGSSLNGKKASNNIKDDSRRYQFHQQWKQRHSSGLQRLPDGVFSEFRDERVQ